MSDRELYLGVFGLGISPRHRGFELICGVLGAMERRGSAVFRPEEVYPLLGIAGDTERRSAERCMRYALQYAWDTPGSALQKLLPRAPAGGPPRLGDFFCAAACLLSADENR